jgi:hypothetical protein
MLPEREQFLFKDTSLASSDVLRNTEGTVLTGQTDLLGKNPIPVKCYALR